MKRTTTQNKAMHVYHRLLAEALNDAGYDMRKTLKPQVEIPWDEKTVKEYLWKPIMDMKTFKLSTTELDSGEVSEIYEILNRHISEKFGVHVPFPHDDTYPQLN